MQGIVPRSRTPGTDLCGLNSFCYIIRSDLGCYMRCKDFSLGSNLTVLSLHPACKDGNHYLGYEDKFFYIIKKSSYRRVTDLTTDSGSVVYSLHPNCQGGDHYLSASGTFYIIFQEKGTYRRTTDLHTDADAEERELHPGCRSGVYFWGLPELCCLLTADSQWGVQFRTTPDLSTEEHQEFYIHPDALNFIPGGLTVTKGPAFCIWENIESVTNNSKTAVSWQKKLKRRIGYNKHKFSQITLNWKMFPADKYQDLLMLILKRELYFSNRKSYYNKTENDSWRDVSEAEDQLAFELKPGESLYVWQYQLGFGKETVLFCRDLKIEAKPHRPSFVRD